MAISSIQAFITQPVQAPAPLKLAEETPMEQPVIIKDSAFISEKAKDLAAQMSNRTVQEESKESPVVEQREQERTPIPTKPTSIAED